MPGAVLFDLDDTLLDTSGGAATCWEGTVASFAPIEALDARALLGAIDAVRDWFWSDAERHRRERQDMLEAWRKLAELALQRLGIETVRAAQLSPAIARDYAQRRAQAERLFDDALPLLRALRARGVRLGLVTNGGAGVQRGKIERHGLGAHFESITIEGELGVGKPCPAAYEHALATLGARAEETWMIGDNLDWDIRGAQEIGLRALYLDRAGRGVRAPHRPDRTLRTLEPLVAELVDAR